MVVASISTLIVNANTSAVTILLPEISDDVRSPVSVPHGGDRVPPRGRCMHRDVACSATCSDTKVFIGGLVLFIASSRSSPCPGAAWA